MIAQAPNLFPAKNYLNWLMSVEDTACQMSFSVYSMTEETQFLGFMFP